jgi:hypothetical protein
MTGSTGTHHVATAMTSVKAATAETTRKMESVIASVSVIEIESVSGRRNAIASETERGIENVEGTVSRGAAVGNTMIGIQAMRTRARLLCALLRMGGVLRFLGWGRGI